MNKEEKRRKDRERYHKNVEYERNRRRKRYAENRESELSQQKAHYANNLDRMREYGTKYRKQAKLDFLVLYGNCCSCCGETYEEFLTIEHKLGQKGIKIKKKSTKAYRLAIKEYRPDLYEILCMNCNHSKGQYGYCPHNKG